MYGVVNKTIEDLVKTSFGEEKWEMVKRRIMVDIDFFIRSEPYNDAVTFLLASAISDEMNIPLEDVFQAFGEWWVLKNARETPGNAIEAMGDNLVEFLLNVAALHDAIRLMNPNPIPVEFSVTEIKRSSLQVHYLPKRQGLREFVKGVLCGLNKLYKTSIATELIASRASGNKHEVFKVTWRKYEYGGVVI
ncbi:MAG: heme NO-binding domain-containing protein [Mucilaginibacter sp.]